jgi:hypothetical protein
VGCFHLAKIASLTRGRKKIFPEGGEYGTAPAAMKIS